MINPFLEIKMAIAIAAHLGKPGISPL